MLGVSPNNYLELVDDGSDTMIAGGKIVLS